MLKSHHKIGPSVSSAVSVETAGRMNLAIEEFRLEAARFMADRTQPKLPSLDFVHSVLDIESKIFARSNLTSLSLASQINERILSRFTARHCGIVFVGFENTLCNLLALTSIPYQFSLKYSEAPGRIWADVCRSLRAKGFMVVMCVNQCTYGNEFYTRRQNMIFEILPWIDACLYIPNIFPRAAVVAYVQRLIADTSHPPITDFTFLVDCESTHAEIADLYGIKVVHTRPVIPILYGLLPPSPSSPTANHMSPAAAALPSAPAPLSRPGSLGGFSFGDSVADVPHSFVSVGSVDLRDLSPD